MTTKEIAVAVGKAEKTVRTWASKATAKSAEATAKSAEATPAHPADWTLDESCAIIEVGLGKNAASLFRENAKNKAVPAVGSSLTARDMEVIGGIVAAIMASMNSRVEKIEAKIEQRQALLPAPQIKPRDNVNKIVREFAHKQGIEHSVAFGDFTGSLGIARIPTQGDPRRTGAWLSSTTSKPRA